MQETDRPICHTKRRRITNTELNEITAGEKNVLFYND